MNVQDIEKCISMDDKVRAELAAVAQKFQLSGRGFHRVIKVAQTISDLEKSPRIRKEHLLEALQYRGKHTED